MFSEQNDKLFEILEQLINGTGIFNPYDMIMDYTASWHLGLW